MPVPRRRHCPSRRDRGRANFGLATPAWIACPNCGKSTRPHHVCQECGSYKGRVYKVIVTK